MTNTTELPHVSVQGAVIERIDALRFGLGVLVDEEFHAELLGHARAHLVHGLELPGRIDMQRAEMAAAPDRRPSAPSAASPMSPCRSNRASPAFRTPPPPRA